jgi:asparagine synthase (glutamine-hydrolysing)
MHFDLRPSIEAIKHRGPDDQGEFHSDRGDCHLGHVRLSILDLTSAGRQPMEDCSGNFVISFNGEIYNFRELKRDIEARYGPLSWRSETDTEVVVEGFAREGRAFLNRLNGMFALAIFDKASGVLHVLRDPLGIKPLFVTHQGGAVFFCSELKGLLALPWLRRTLREGALADQLAFMYLPEPFTFFEEFTKVEPGVCFTYRQGRQVASTRLFEHLEDPSLKLGGEEEAIVLLREHMDRAVVRQLMADVPVSLFLSGGLDSSAVAHFAVQGGAKVKSAYTIAFSEADLRLDSQGDDLRYARLMAERLGLDLQVIPAGREFMARLPELIGFMEDGFTDPSAINTYVISAAARAAGVKVMLSGQGADEYLGGYRRYQAERLLERIPSPMRLALAGVGGGLARLSSGAAGRRMERLARLAGQSPSARMLGMYTWTSPETLADLLDGRSLWSGGEIFRDRFGMDLTGDIVARMLRIDQWYDLMSLNLCYTDRMSMAVGLEARVPFLDFDLVRLMNAIPTSLKVKGREGKYVLKKAMEPHLPRSVIYREKTGFGLPLRAWLQGPVDLVDHYLDSGRIARQGRFRAAAVQRLLAEQRAGKADHAYTLFTLLCQQIWLEKSGVA